MCTCSSRINVNRLSKLRYKPELNNRIMNIKNGERMKNILLPISLAMALIFISGCMSFELEGDGLKTPKSAHGSETVHGSLYGFEWSSLEIEKSSDHLGLLRVEYHTNNHCCQYGLIVNFGYYADILLRS